LRPRILFLTESFHPVLGGGEAHVRALSRRLAALGMAPTVVTRRSDAAWPRVETLDGVKVIRVPPSGPGRAGKYAMVPAALASLRSERRRHEVLVVRGTRVLGLPGLLAGRALVKAVVLQAEVNGEMSGEVFTWGTSLEASWLRPLVERAVRARNRLLGDADAFVAMSRRIREEFLEAGVPERRIAYIPHGVDLARFRPPTSEEKREARRALGLAAHELIATYTGRLLRGKGLMALVEAFAVVARRDSRSRLLLVGSGAGQSLSVEEELKAAVVERGLDGRVTFAGRVDDVRPHLWASDVFVFPSEFEALGLSLVEAAACGLPCVGARTGGIVDVIEEGRSGLLFEPGDAGALAECVEAVLAAPARAAAFGARGREVARERFDLDESAERYAALFAELAGRAGTTGN